MHLCEISPHTRDWVDSSILSAPRADERGGPGSELRCDPHGRVPTLMASPWPGGKATHVVHWSVSRVLDGTDGQQQRVLSVAERRRVQGLPDDYVLRGTVKEVSPHPLAN